MAAEMRCMMGQGWKGGGQSSQGPESPRRLGWSYEGTENCKVYLPSAIHQLSR